MASKNWLEWRRMWIYCDTCEKSWFEEVGEASTCTCTGVEEE